MWILYHINIDEENTVEKKNLSDAQIAGKKV
jgi:hypothetical protein